LTRTVPTPGTLFALIVTAGAADDPPAGAELAEPEPEAVLLDEDPQAATVIAAPRTRLPPSSRYTGERPRGRTVMLMGKLLLCSRGCAFPLLRRPRPAGLDGGRGQNLRGCPGPGPSRRWVCAGLVEGALQGFDIPGGGDRGSADRADASGLGGESIWPGAGRHVVRTAIRHALRHVGCQTACWLSRDKRRDIRPPLTMTSCPVRAIMSIWPIIRRKTCFAPEPGCTFEFFSGY